MPLRSVPIVTIAVAGLAMAAWLAMSIQTNTF
jgi:hypothetical protein